MGLIHDGFNSVFQISLHGFIVDRRYSHSFDFGLDYDEWDRAEKHNVLIPNRGLKSYPIQALQICENKLLLF